MRIWISIAIIALACGAFAQASDKVSLVSKIKPHITKKFKVAAKVIDQFEIKGVVEVKVTKSEKDIPIEAEWKCIESTQSGGGMDSSDVPPALNTKIDKYGLPETLSVDEGRAIYVALAIASYRPSEELAIGSSFKIDWKGKNDGGIILGNGTLKEVKTVDGVKVAVVVSKVEMTPAGQQQPADFEVVSEFDLSDGSLIKSSIKGTIGEGEFTCSVTLTK